MQNLDLETALQKVVEKVREGAGRMEFPDAEEVLAEAWRPDFERELGNGTPWHKVEPVLLPLAYQVGTLARVLTLGKWVGAEGMPPSRIHPDCARLAAYMVKKTSLDCLEVARKNERGAFCRGLTAPGGVEEAILEPLLQSPEGSASIPEVLATVEAPPPLKETDASLPS